MEADGVIEKFNPRDKTITFLHFLAHHAVIKESSATTKMRSVFDGSAHLPGMPSINDFLHRGPVLLPTMAGILLRTRMHGIVIIADIAKAFLQVSLHPTDRSACAFLWLKDPTKPPDDDNIVFYRFKRVTFGLKPSPFLLGAVIQFHLEQQGPLAEEIWRNCYVDNIILSADTLDEALAKYRGTKELFASAKMNVRQFASNSKEFNRQMPPEDLADLEHLMNLGYNWHVETDTWRVSYVPKPDKTSTRKRKGPKKDDGRLTKRKMMRQIMRIFDPLQLTAPAPIAAKLAIQEAFKLPLKWDDYVGADIEAIWSHATKDFENSIFEIPRHICAGPIPSLELHICVDASQDAYGFASYIRVPLNDARTKFDVSLAFSRCKVKPISADEKMTIPRMELMAMAFGARNAVFLKEELFGKNITRVTIWSDSMIVLLQLRNPQKTKERFVENRLEEIRKLQDKLGFDTRYVNTSDNPGDIISRGIPAAQLQSCELWWKGIPFLRGPDSEWPLQPPALLEPLPTKDSSESLFVEQGSYGSPYEQSFFVQRPGTIWSH
ncbi:Pao retrotransposon peptidase family protein [Aphelenchoides avenae]|nr:Pao retrotransposon peptidase family protein [Aphelenchus avenae]